MKRKLIWLIFTASTLISIIALLYSNTIPRSSIAIDRSWIQDTSYVLSENMIVKVWKKRLTDSIQLKKEIISEEKYGWSCKASESDFFLHRLNEDQLVEIRKEYDYDNSKYYITLDTIASPEKLLKNKLKLSRLEAEAKDGWYICGTAAHSILNEGQDMISHGISEEQANRILNDWNL